MSLKKPGRGTFSRCLPSPWVLWALSFLPLEFPTWTLCSRGSFPLPEGFLAAWGSGVDITGRENFPKSRAQGWVFPGERSWLLIPSAHGSFGEPPLELWAVFLQENSLSPRLVQHSPSVPVGVWDIVLRAPQLSPSPHSFLGIILPYFPLLHREL